MPTYEYLCEMCGTRFERIQSMSSKILKKCPACKNISLVRLLGIGIHLFQSVWKKGK